MADPAAPAAPSIFADAAPTPAPVAAKTTAAAKAPVTAKDKLRAFEDKIFGKDAPRINGELEHGVGSPWANMTPAQKRHHHALERMVEAEQKVAEASAALAHAEADHDVAVKSAEAAASAVPAADPKPDPNAPIAIAAHG